MPTIIAIQTTNNQIQLGDVEYFENHQRPSNTMRFIIVDIREDVFEALITMAADNPQKFAKTAFTLINDVGGIHMG